MTGTKTLTAVVVYVEGRGRVRVATQMTIKMGNAVVATRTMGGRWSQEKTLTELRRNPRAFIVSEGTNLEWVCAACAAA